MERRLRVHPGFQQEAARSFHAGEDLLIGQVWRFDEYLGREVLVIKLAAAPARVVTQGQGKQLLLKHTQGATESL